MYITKLEEKIAEAIWYKGLILTHKITVFNDDDILHHYIAGSIHITHSDKKVALELLVEELKNIKVEV